MNRGCSLCLLCFLQPQLVLWFWVMWSDVATVVFPQSHRQTQLIHFPAPLGLDVSIKITSKFPLLLPVKSLIFLLIFVSIKSSYMSIYTFTILCIYPPIRQV